MSDHGDRAGAGPAGPGRRRPPSRRMRERADEMADLLAHAAPAVRANRRRRSAAIPAAVVALGALTVGGVGVAVGIDSEPARATALPGGPAVPADRGGQPIGPAEDDPRPTSAVVDVPVEPDEDQDDRSSSSGDGRPDLARPPVAAPHRPVAAPTRPRATPGDEDDDDRDDDPRSSSSTPSSTTSKGHRPTTTRPRPSDSDDGRDGRDGRDEPSGSTTRSGRSTTPADAQLRADGLDGRSLVPTGSPTGDEE